MAPRPIPTLLLVLVPTVSAQIGGIEYDDDTNGLIASELNKCHRVLIAHAVLGTLAWSLLAPIGAVLLRLDIRGTNLLRLHWSCQLTVYTMYAASAGLGIYVRWKLHSSFNADTNLWAYPHAAIGMLVLIFMGVQSILGYIHHVIFKRRFNALKADETSQTLRSHGKKPGRTAITYMHLWLGRILILVAIVNGGLGIHVTGQSYLQDMKTSRVALIAYCIVTGCIALPVVYILRSWECRRAAGIRRARLELEIPAMNVEDLNEDEQEWQDDGAPGMAAESRGGADKILMKLEDVSRDSLEVGKKTLEIMRNTTRASSVADASSLFPETSRKYSAVSVGGRGVMMLS